MQALIYLTVRSFVNGIRRALTSWKRLVSLVGISLYYFWFFVRPWQKVEPMPAMFSHPIVTMPDLRLIDAIVFTVFALLTVVLMLTVEQGSSAFRPADVDVLFPTPVSPKLVLGLRFVRDALVTLIFPLFLAALSFRPTSMGIETFVQNFPKEGGYVLRAAIVAWFLLAITWVSIRYAVGLSINRSDLRSDRNKKLLTWSLGAIILVCGASLGLQLPHVHSMQDFVDLAGEWPYRTCLFTATFATDMVMAPLQGHWFNFFKGMGGLVLTFLVSFQVALAQTDTMYDQSAAKAYAARDRIKALRSRGWLGLVDEKAKQGKIRAGKQRWYHRLTLPGPLALIWKELVIQMRSGGLRSGIVAIAVVGLALIPLMAVGHNLTFSGALLMGMLTYGQLLTCGIWSQMSLLEMLRRVDLQKPLPFSPQVIVFFEILGKAAFAIALNTATCLLAIAVRPELWAWSIAAMIFLPSLAIILVSANFGVMVMFPDIDDPTQRGFRGFLTLLGYVVLCAPGAGMFILVALAGLNVIVGAFVGGIINLGIAAGASYVGGVLFASFNPSE